jgi:sulfate adenylyltransferase
MTLPKPHGNQLVNLFLSNDEKAGLASASDEYKSWDLIHRQICDVELLMNGAFSPLTGFMTRADYQPVLSDMRLASGLVWPMPVTLDVSQEFADGLVTGEKIELRDPEGVLIAYMDVEDIWQPDKKVEAEQIFGADDDAHPAVYYLHAQAGPVYLGGRVYGVTEPHHYDFIMHRSSPAELREQFKKMGWRKVVAFQTRNPMHRAHQELTFRAAQQAEANLLIHPVVGMTKPGDVDHYSRVRCYQHLLDHYPEQTTALSLLPLAMRMGGPREALWHAIIRKNYGCTHFIVGRDHAGPGKNSQGEDFYGPYDAQELVAKHEEEIGIKMVPFEAMVYVDEKAEYIPLSEVKESDTVRNISGTEFRRRLQEGLDIPEWFSFPEVVAELRRTYPPKHKQGFTVFFTGLSGAGKSTIANALLTKLLERGDRPVTLLDGDIVRKNLSSELGFSKEHRNLNVTRIGYVASEIVKHRGIAICAPIAPYQDVRRQVRENITQFGGFVEVYVSTPIEECEHRDRKGLYAKARAGLIKGFTGIDDPYEAPESPEVNINTLGYSPDEAALEILLKLEKMGFIKS